MLQLSRPAWDKRNSHSVWFLNNTAPKISISVNITSENSALNMNTLSFDVRFQPLLSVTVRQNNKNPPWFIYIKFYSLYIQPVPSLHSLPLPLSVHCSRFRCCAGRLMVNFGLGPGGERGEEAAATKKRWHFTAIIHPCFVPAALRSVCTGMECRAEGCWDGGMNGVGCGGRRGVIGGLRGEEVMGLKCETPMRRG